MPEQSKKPAPTVKREVSPLAGVLSLLIPGAGQIYQQRFSKGLLFFCSIYLLFFYGLYLGQGKNVYMVKAGSLPNPITDSEGVLNDLWHRPQYIAQFWVGLAAWPALYQRMNYDETKEEGPIFGAFQREPFESRRKWERANPLAREGKEPRHPTINQLQQESDKMWDLGWVLTVIAGALNVMVIYDAVAGPAFPPEEKREQESKS